MPNQTHLPCPFKECGSTDAFSWNPEKACGKCFSCSSAYPGKGTTFDWVQEKYPITPRTNYHHKGPQMNNPPQQTTHQEYLTEVFRGSRGISDETMKFYNVPTLVDSNGLAIRQVYTYPSGGKKIRTLPKSFRAENGLRGDELFGMDRFNAGSSKSVVVTEGELDALSAFQMLGARTPCVSLPSASPNQKLFERCKDWLDSFERIYLSFDSDMKSEPIAQKLANLFPNRVYSIPHDKYKDANEFLQAGAKESYVNAYKGARKYTPENVFNSPEQFLSILHDDDDSTYTSTGIQALDDVILGLMRGHFTVFSAPEGVGKTEFMRYLEFGMLTRHTDIPIAICHMEEVKKRSLLGLASYELGKNVTRKDLIKDQEEVDQAVIRLASGERLYQFTIGVDEDPMEILNQIRFLSEACGVHYVFFEPIQDLAYSRQSDETAEQFLSQLATKLSRLAAELNVGIVTIAHENDDGAIRDCRMIGKRASVVIKLERDKMAKDPEVRNTTKLLVVKNRPTGMTGYAGQMFFDGETFLLSEKFVGE